MTLDHLTAQGGPQSAARARPPSVARGGPQPAARGRPPSVAQGGPQSAVGGRPPSVAQGGPQSAACAQAGYAQQTITPSLERTVYLAGFGHNRLAQDVHDDLYVRALGLALGDTRVVLAALDLLGLSRAHCQEIERRVNERAPGTRLILACTHTHHGPDTLGLWGPDATTSGADPDYLASLKDKAVDTALAALSQLQPAQLRAVSVHVPGVAKNARDPHILDDELTALQFCHPRSGAPLATALIFPCHPEVLWEHNPHVTSDYPGFLRRKIEAQTGAPSLFFAGALGGMMTPDVQDHSFTEAEAMGNSLAQAALDTLRGVERIAVASAEILEHTCHEFAIPMTNPLFQLAMEEGLLPKALTGEGTVITEANLLKIGPVWLAGVPGELLPKLGLALKADLRRAGAQVAGVVGLANDELGYILPQEDYIYPEDPFDPGDHYEETMSIGPEAGPRLLSAVRAMLE